MKFILPLLMLLSSPPPAVWGDDARLHEHEAEFGGDFEDSFAIAGGVSGVVEIDELPDDEAAAGGEIGEAGAGGLGSARRAGCAGEHAIDGFDEFGGVIRDEADGLAIDVETVLLNGGLDGRELAGGDSGKFGELEEDGSEAIEEGDEAIGVAAAAAEVGGTEGAPGGGDGAVEFFVTDAAEGLRVGGGAASADGGEGASLTEDATEVDEFCRGIAGELGVGQICPALV
jgi:hypothetical protein